MRNSSKWLILVLMVSMVFILGCIVYGSVAGGEFIDLGGYRLFIESAGKGKPVIIMDSAYATPCETWDTIKAQVQEFATIVVYDRAGVGKSDQGPSPRTSERMAEELHALLEKAKIKPPYILVGHSFGGFNTRIYTSKYPDEVAGLILVDVSHEDQDERFIGALPEEFQDMYYGQFTLETTYEEFHQSAEQARSMRNSLYNVPLIVLTADNHQVPAEIEAIWYDMQKDLASLSRKSKHYLIPNCGHFIQNDQPQEIIRAIQEMMHMTKGKVK